jgi:anti-sigma-K factor RskA
VTAVVSKHDREAVITAAGMPAPGDARVYQLWVISPAGYRSLGLLPSSSAGATSPVLADDVQPGDQLAVTIEPAGGTRLPTTIPIVSIHTHP